MSVSVMVFTLNEEVHLPSCLKSLEWTDDVIVVDSFSTDQSEEICRTAGVTFVQHRFEGFGSQRNWALDNLRIKHDWLLILDADERVPDDLALELLEISARNPANIGAYRVRRRFYMWGRWLQHSSLYPTWVVRFVHRRKVRYINRGHAETQEVDGLIGDLTNDLIDENQKGISEWFTRHIRYAAKEAEFELDAEGEPVSSSALWGPDPLVRRALLKRLGWKLPLRPLVYFLYSYVFRAGFMDGYDGFIFCAMKSAYQVMILAHKRDLRRNIPE